MNLDFALILFAIGGALVGLGADLISRGWPAHLPEYVKSRGVRWQTAVLMLTGAAAFTALAAQWGVAPREFLILFVYFVALTVLLATDLDQKLLPDLITLPLIVFSAAILLLGWSPLLAGKSLGLVSGIGAGIGAPVLLWIGDRVLHGDLGWGDLKLAASIGLMSGVTGFFLGMLMASIGFAVVLLVLMAFRRIGLKSAVPFGPVLIYAAFAAVLIR